MFEAKVYGQSIQGASLATIKRKASKIANSYNNAIDEMTITSGEHTAKYYRINRKAPNNTIERGAWK